MSTAISWLFPRMSSSSVADLDTLVSIILFCGAGLVLSLSVLLLDQYIPGNGFSHVRAIGKPVPSGYCHFFPKWRPGSLTYLSSNLGVFGAFFAGFVAPGFAHDPGHPELNAWFDSPKSSKGLCCSFTDGSAVSDVDWESKGGHYRVRLENNWIDVPDEALITEPNRVGRTMVWPLRVDHQIFIRCFMPGSMG